MRRVIFCLSIFLFCALAPFFDVARAAGSTYISSDISTPTVWTKADSPYLVNGTVTVNAPLTIEAGTVVKLNAAYHAILVFRNNLFVKGTREEPVVFTSSKDDSYGGDTNGDGGRFKPAPSDWTYLNFNPYQDYILEVNHAKILYSSFGLSIYASNGHYLKRSVKNSEFKYNGYGLMINDAQPTIENNTISNNGVGISVSASTKTAKISNNAIYGNATGAEGLSYSPGLTAIEAKYNWWGDKSGPQNASNPGGKGDLASGSISFDPWLKVDPIATPDPVIVIPGIMGSWQVDGKWAIDPIFHTYDNLRDEFLANGYEDGKSFFTFPYEWRNSNVDNAKLLEKKIEQIKKDTGRPKVDIVAHSMGGLLAREYIESDYYGNDVDQLITVGTPQLGAPEDYTVWEAGEFLGLWAPVLKRVVALEALENGYLDIFSYIHKRPLDSVEELLPTYNYLYDENGGDWNLRSSYPANYPRNQFLESLNSAGNIKLLKSVEFTKIIGKTNDKASTESSFNVINDKKHGFWEHGYPKYFDIPVLNRQGTLKGDGDTTVPFISAEASDIPADRILYFQSEHGNLPTDAQKDILEILTGKRPASEVKKWQIPSVLVVLLHSPIDMQVISPSGEKIGKNFETDGTYDEIDGAYYSGFDTNTEFLTIPNPEDGEYKILTEGTGTGEYTIETAKITQNKTTGDTVEATATITGTTNPDVQEENKIKIDGDTVKKVEPLMLSSKNKSEETGVETAGVVLGASQIQESLETVQNQLLTDSSNDQKGKIQQLDDLRNSVLEYFKANQIKTRKEAAAIVKNLGHIRVHLKNYEILGKKSRLPQKALLGAKTKANRHIGDLASHISRNFPKKINEEARNDLVENLNNLKIVI
jgi:parallel beta-helix repeat protein